MSKGYDGPEIDDFRSSGFGWGFKTTNGGFADLLENVSS